MTDNRLDCNTLTASPSHRVKVQMTNLDFKCSLQQYQAVMEHEPVTLDRIWEMSKLPFVLWTVDMLPKKVLVYATKPADVGLVVAKDIWIGQAGQSMHFAERKKETASMKADYWKLTFVVEGGRMWIEPVSVGELDPDRLLHALEHRYTELVKSRG